MLKKTITYTDFNGNERTEDLYFNLTKAEILKMEMSIKGGLAERIKRIISAQDQPAIMEVFDDLITRSYGVKSPDGKTFLKNQALVDEFVQSEAYSVLFMELCTDADAAAKFINGIVPADVSKQLPADAGKQFLANA